MVDTQEQEIVSSVSTTRGTLSFHLNLFRKQWWWIAIFSLVAGCVAFAVSLSQPEVYRSTSVLYVSSVSDGNAQSAYQGSLASQQRVASYARLVRSDAVIKKAIAQMPDSALSVDAVKHDVAASTTPDTVLLTITADNRSASTASELVNAVSSAMVEYVATIEQSSDGGQPLAKLTVITPGTIPSAAVSPKMLRNTLVGLLVGLLVGMLFVIVRARLDTRVRGQKDLSALVDAPVLAAIPRSSEAIGESVIDLSDTSSGVVESYRLLRANLAYVSVDSPVRLVTVTSPSESEGKTTTSVNLCAVLAESGATVLLVDSDLRRPNVYRRFGITNDVGFTDFLRGAGDVESLIQSTGTPGLDVLACGPIPPNPTALLGTQMAAKAFQQLGKIYDYIIVDAPPVLPVADVSILAQWTDGVVLVARDGVTRRSSITDAVSRLRMARISVFGTILNSADEVVSSYGYYRRDEDTWLGASGTE